ncbi:MULTISPECIES: Lrp/AsnC family transcriptional regulator [Nocardiopsis]|uniref:AsnC family transcriptional regulator n=1 Tax=Nocardiopsis sinuspersici TaxID=501010 RepID=A0A1V3CA71_9ACTN|nr:MULTISPECIES: Lrp/AsnC family transcriptional regulator [Nocardiopsis]NYH51626.1 Lrp/AsnC family transcriptional regulator for asnA, asnC and gidA [Nocardiopsis sinuspersici]OOC57260.1 AsnC family transcriptional regulator [Nocardiopsis sinuspersici]
MTEQPDPSPVRRTNGVVLDDTAKRIIEVLQEDGRRSYAAIGKAVGLSEAAVRQRVQRLLEAEVVQVVGVTDPMMLGFHRQAMIGVRTTGDLNAAADAVSDVGGVEYVVITAGSFDLMVEVVAEDDAKLLDILANIRAIDTVSTTETFLYLKLRKQTYAWGTR